MSPGHRLVQNLLLAPVRELGKRETLPALADESDVEIAQRALVAPVDEQVVDRRRELVAGRPVHRPFRGKLLAGPEDLFHHDVEGQRREAVAGVTARRRR